MRLWQDTCFFLLAGEMDTTWKNRRVVGASLIILITLLAYRAALPGGFIWDDDLYITKNMTLRSLDGLTRMWMEPGAVPQYYPLTHTTFWIEYHLWQLNPFGYHLDNVLLQALNAILLWAVLQRLRIPGAWLAAALFAVHPVQVESVAWITERKNVLSCAFYLSALLAYLRFYRWDEAEESERNECPQAGTPVPPGVYKTTSMRWGYYWLAFAFFVCAVLSKTVTCTLPAAILVLIWWKRGRVGWRDVCPLVPFCVVGAALGWTTAWIEKYRAGAEGTEWGYGFAERLLIAGRAVWFYAAKLALPAKLTFIYPRWNIDAGQWWQWLFPLAAVTAAVALWVWRRRIGRGPLAAMLFFVGTLGPALGFVNVYPMRYSFVADHFQYLASAGLIAAAVAAAATVVKQRTVRIASGVVVIALFSVLTARQGQIYHDQETLWRDTLAKNPDCWMAHNNLGVLLAARGDLPAARAEYQAALRIKPDAYDPYNNLGNLWKREGQTEKAVTEYRQSLRIEPGYALARYNLALALAQLGKVDEAIAQYRFALVLEPGDADAHYNLGIALGKQGRFAEACAQFAEAAHDQPGSARNQYNWGFALAKQADFDHAISHYRVALELNPDFAAAHYGLGVALLQNGRRAEAIQELQRALQLQPDSHEVRQTLEAARARV
jgi:protein O-mannosyl-transferase